MCSVRREKDKLSIPARLAGPEGERVDYSHRGLFDLASERLHEETKQHLSDLRRSEFGRNLSCIQSSPSSKVVPEASADVEEQRANGERSRRRRVGIPF